MTPSSPLADPLGDPIEGRETPPVRGRRWPDTSGLDYRVALSRVLRDGTLTEGPETDALEREFGDLLGREVVALSSGTNAVEAALRSLDVGPGDQVIVPALTFSGTALPVMNVGADLVFADVRRDTFNLDADHVEALMTDRTKAVIAVHLHGLPAPMYRLERLSAHVVEDACQAYGAEQDGRTAGAITSRAAFSLNRTKTVFAGEGGLYVTQSPEDARRIRSLRRFGEAEAADPARRWSGGRDVALEAGAGNWKMTEMAAAIARQSLRELPVHVGRARANAGILREACEASGLLTPPHVPAGSKHAWHKFRVTVADDAQWDIAFYALEALGVPVCRWQTSPLPLHPAFEDGWYPGQRVRIGDYSETRWVLDHTFVVGTEDRPLCAWTPAETGAWAEKIAQLGRHL